MSSAFAPQVKGQPEQYICYNHYPYLVFNSQEELDNHVDSDHGGWIEYNLYFAFGLHKWNVFDKVGHVLRNLFIVGEELGNERIPAQPQIGPYDGFVTWSGEVSVTNPYPDKIVALVGFNQYGDHMQTVWLSPRGAPGDSQWWYDINRWMVELHFEAISMEPSATVTVDPNGGRVLVDGSSITAQTSFTWNIDSTHTLDADSGYEPSSGTRLVFTQWSDGSTSDPQTITVTGDATYTALWKTQYLLTIDVSPSGGGSTSPSPGGYWYDPATSVTVTETPSSGYVFDYWDLDGSNVGTGVSYTVTLDAPHSLTAVFQTLAATTTISVTANVPNPSYRLNNPFTLVDARYYIESIYSSLPHGGFLTSEYENDFGVIPVSVTIMNTGSQTTDTLRIDATLRGTVRFVNMFSLVPGAGNEYQFEYSMLIGTLASLDPGDTVTLDLAMPVKFASVNALILFGPSKVPIPLEWVSCLLGGASLEVEVTGSNTNVAWDSAQSLYAVDAASEGLNLVKTALSVIISYHLTLQFKKISTWIDFAKVWGLKVASSLISKVIVALETEIVNKVIPVGTKIVTFVLKWLGSTLRLTAYSPSGVRFEGVVEGTLSTITVHDPEVGEWTIEIYGESIPAEEESFDLGIVALSARARAQSGPCFTTI